MPLLESYFHNLLIWSAIHNSHCELVFDMYTDLAETLCTNLVCEAPFSENSFQAAQRGQSEGCSCGIWVHFGYWTISWSFSFL